MSGSIQVDELCPLEKGGSETMGSRMGGSVPSPHRGLLILIIKIEFIHMVNCI
jgi:hypothetical protein